MNRDIVKRLAIQSGIDLEFFQAGEVFSFATAIAKQAVEEFKAGLVPVAEVAQETFGDGQVIWFKEYPEDGTKLYALGETK